MKEKKLHISRILLDVGNPRFEPVQGQSLAADSLMGKCGSKILSLADDIVKNGISPADRLLCVESRTEEGKILYIAKEGNRRLLALKSLRKPSLISNTELRARLVRILRANGGFGKAPSWIEACVFQDNERSELNHWISLKHNGENGGAGVVPWGSEEKKRFSSQGNAHFDLGLSALNWLRSRTDVSSEDQALLKKVPITTFERILAYASGRVLLGLDVKDGQLQAIKDVKVLERNLLKVVQDLTLPHDTIPRRKRINVSDVKNTTQIQKYLEQFAGNDELKPPVTLQCDATANSSPDADFQSNRNRSDKSAARATKSEERDIKDGLRRLSSCASNTKVKQLAEELASMQIVAQPLVYSIAWRTLVEVSLLIFASKHGIHIQDGDKKRVSYESLASNCKNELMNDAKWNSGVAKDLVNSGVKVLVSKTLFSITELNALAHGILQVPSCDIIRTYVPRLIPFLIALNGGSLN